MLERFVKPGIAALLVCAPMAAAHATVTTVCSTGSANVCIDFTLTNIGTTFTLQVSVTTAPATASLYQFGIDAGPGITLSNAGNILVNGSPNLGWDIGCNGLPNLDECAEGPTGGGGLHQGDIASFTFTASTSSPFANDLQAHLQNVSNGCSMKIGTQTTDFANLGKNGVGSFNFDDVACSVTPTTTSPEPASLWLVGTGLLGMAGGGAIRRRRRRV